MYVLSVAISRITKYGALTDKQNMNSDMQYTDKLDHVKLKRFWFQKCINRGYNFWWWLCSSWRRIVTWDTIIYNGYWLWTVCWNFGSDNFWWCLCSRYFVDRRVVNHRGWRKVCRNRGDNFWCLCSDWFVIHWGVGHDCREKELLKDFPFFTVYTWRNDFAFRNFFRIYRLRS